MREDLIINQMWDKIRNLENEMLLIRSGEIAKHGVATKEDTAIKVKVGAFVCPGSTGNYSVTGVGFKPRYVEFFVSRHLEGVALICHGWMDYNGNQASQSIGFSTVPAGHSSCNATYCISFENQNGILFMRAVYVSMNSDGFTINFDTVNANYTIYWKAVR